MEVAMPEAISGERDLYFISDRTFSQPNNDKTMLPSWREGMVNEC